MGHGEGAMTMGEVGFGLGVGPTFFEEEGRGVRVLVSPVMRAASR